MKETETIPDAEVTNTAPGTAIAKTEAEGATVARVFSPEDLLVPTHADAAKPDRSFAATPYVGFLGRKSEKNVEAIKAAGVQVNEFYLHAGAAGIVRVKPFGMHLLGQTFRCFTVQDEDGKLIDAALKWDRDRDSEGYIEHIFAVVAVVLPSDDPVKPSNFVAATFNARGAQAKVFKKAMDLLGTADAPGAAYDAAKWSAFGAAHKRSAASRYPFGRFRAEITSVPTTPAGGGRPYNLGESRILPTPEIDIAAFDEWVTREWPSIASVLAIHDRRVQQIKRKAEESGNV